MDREIEWQINELRDEIARLKNRCESLEDEISRHDSDFDEINNELKKLVENV